MGGAYSTTSFSSDTLSGKPVIHIGAQQTAKYSYAGQLCVRTYILKINLQGTAPAAVTRDGGAVPQFSASGFAAASEGWYFDATARTVWAKFPLAFASSTTVSL